MSQNIKIPHNFTARPYQVAGYNCLDDGFKRGVFVWHRRAGKDKLFVNVMAREACKKVGTYFYILPYYKQARLVIWDNIDSSGFRFRNHVPPQLVLKQNDQMMTQELKNGSIIRYLGSDNIDSIVGSNPLGVMFSEFSLHKPAAWNYLRPILRENGGWAFFNGTPRGRNHFYEMFKMSEKDPNWFCQLLTVEDTGVMTPEDVEDEIDNGMPRELAMQEFYCSWEAALVGSYYGDILDQSFVGHVPWEPELPVHTAWDLGISKDNSLVVHFFQLARSEVRVIDRYHTYNESLIDVVKVLKEKPYVYGYHALPHDIKVRELSTGKARWQTLRKHGLKNLKFIPKLSKEEGRNAVRLVLPRCAFDEDNCRETIEALKTYRREWDDANRKFLNHDHSDWSVHDADAFRMLALAVRDGLSVDEEDIPSRTAKRDFNFSTPHQRKDPKRGIVWR